MGPTHVAQSLRGGAITSGLERQCWPWGAWLHVSDSESDTPGPGCCAGDVLVPARLRLSGKQVWRRVRERYKDAWKWVFAGKLKKIGPVSVVA